MQNTIQFTQNFIVVRDSELKIIYLQDRRNFLQGADFSEYMHMESKYNAINIFDIRKILLTKKNKLT